MADTAAQAQSQLIFLLTNLGFIINVQKSITSLTDNSGLEGGLNVPTFKFTRREIPPYKGRGQTCAEVAGNKAAVGSTD